MSHARRGRHRRARMLAVAPAVAAAAVGGAVFGASPAHATDWAKVRQCESGGNYATNTGNGYYGAYQFTQQTWSSLGYSGRPDQASAATQDAAAATLAARSGMGQWPVCGAGAGGSSSGSGGSSYSAPQQSSSSNSYSQHSYGITTSTPQAATRSALTPVAPAQAAAPRYPENPSVSPFPTAFFSTDLVHSSRKDVAAWQKRVNSSGLKIAVDGKFGPQSEHAAEAIQAKHHLAQDGVVGPKTWAASFGLPV